MRIAMPASTLTTLRRLLLSAAAAALVCAQSAGLIHRIEHGTATGWISASSAAYEHAAHGLDHDHASEEIAPDQLEHDCAALDALALGSGAPTAELLLPAAAPVAATLLPAERTHSSGARHEPFQARAPPHLFS
jgi:hypothetical protein